MFSVAKLAAAVLALTGLVHATITITSSDLKETGTNTITWTSSDANTDPISFSIELVNPAFNHQFAIGNNIPTTAGTYTFELPAVPPGSYTVQFVDISNINSVLAQSGSFNIEPATTSSLPPTSVTISGSTPTGTASFTSATGGTLTQTGSIGISSSSGTGTGSVVGSGTIGSATSGISRGSATATSPASAATSSSSGSNGVATVHVPVALLAVGLFVGLM